MHSDRKSHSHAVCTRLLDSLLIEPAALLSILFLGDEEGLRLAGAGPDDAARELSPEQSAVEILGRGLWDIFSDNHAVVDTVGTEYDLGSFRGSADFIAESINRRYEIVRYAYGYMDFYMGSYATSRDVLSRLYRWLFSQLRAKGCRWIYTFPRVYLVDFGGIEAEPHFTEYDPGKSLERELDEASRRAQSDELRRSLDDTHDAAIERARSAPLPATVEAYRDVYGEFPEGWPHR